MRYLALAVAAFALPACERAAPDPRGVASDETLLTVTATGRTDTRPDEARLQLGVQSIAGNPGDASRLNREKMQGVTDALTRLGVTADQLQTRNLSLQKVEYGPDKGRFRAENTLEVTMKDVTKVGEAVTAVTEAGANLMSGPDLRVSDREGSSRSAYASAYRAARARAEAYAGAAGLKIDRVLGIYDGGEYGAPIPGRPAPPPISMDASAQVSAPAPFNPGMNTTEVRVRVDFALAR
jgi:uncharacterized protein YggE